MAKKLHMVVPEFADGDVGLPFLAFKSSKKAKKFAKAVRGKIIGDRCDFWTLRVFDDVDKAKRAVIKNYDLADDIFEKKKKR
jgi:hypothetical protein